jgi:hypothetical protein
MSTLTANLHSFTQPSIMEKVAARVAKLLPDSPYIHRKLGDTIDRAQISEHMPKELTAVLNVPQPEMSFKTYVKTPRLNYTGIDSRFSFCFPVEDTNGNPRMRSAKSFMPLFEGADHSYRPGKTPPVLLNIGDKIQSVETFVKDLAQSPNLLSDFPSVKSRDVTVTDTTLQDLIRENGPQRKIVTWALAEASPKRFEVVKANGEIALKDKVQDRIIPSACLEQGWKLDGLAQTPHGYTMTPAVEVKLPASFAVSKPSVGMDI